MGVRVVLGAMRAKVKDLGITFAFCTKDNPRKTTTSVHGDIHLDYTVGKIDFLQGSRTGKGLTSEVIHDTTTGDRPAFGFKTNVYSIFFCTNRWNHQNGNDEY